ncbi:MAG: ATP-binding cassette domain-containing protein [Clostridia bacterium]|nr:ATP-binding cassette domain-containing protein [Clostridia bacterium]
MICLNSVSKEYGTKRKKVLALDDVNLVLPERGMVFLLGKSGSGKTTLLNLIGGLDTPTKGEIVVGDRSLSAFSQDELDDYRNVYAGFVFQEYNLIEGENVASNVGLALSLQGRSFDLPLIDSVLRKVDLIGSDGNTLRDKRIGELSGGQKQRVAIARALVKDPKMILADEPTGALDSKTGDMLFSLLKELSKDRLIVVVTHDRDNAEKYADRIIKLADGKIASDSCPATEEKKPFSEIKGGRFPFRRAFKMGLRGLGCRPFRLISSLILSLICFVVSALMVSFASVNQAGVAIASAYEQGFQIAKIGYGGSGSYRAWFSEEQLALIRSYTGKEEIAEASGYLPEATTSLIFRELPHFEGDIYKNKTNPYFDALNGYSVMEIDWKTGEEDWDLTPDPRVRNGVCRLPKEKDEIAITDFLANAMLRFGIWGYPQNPESIDDIIGKQLYGYTIVGVYRTEIPASLIEQYDRDFGTNWRTDEPMLKYLANGVKDTILSAIFVCRDLFEGERGSAFIKLSGNIDRDLDFLKRFQLLDVEMDLDYYLDENTPGHFETEEEVRLFIGKPSILTLYSDQVSASISMQLYRTLTRTIFAPYFKCALGVSFVFSVLLTMNFLSASLDSRRKELGILRAIGAKRRDLVKICLSESLSLAVIECVLSVILCIVACSTINKVQQLSILSAFWYPVLTIFVLSIFVTLVATVIPVLRLTSKKPAEILKNA